MNTDATRSESPGTVVLPLLTIPTDILESVLAILDASSLVRTSASCKVLQALEVQAREKLWRRLTLDKWPVAASYGSIAQMSWRGRYRFFLKRTTQRTPQHEEGKVLTEEQLNERFEFFIELGKLPHHCVAPWLLAPEQANVSIHLELNNGLLIPREDSTTAEVTGQILHMDVMVRRVSDGAVTVLFHGSSGEYKESWGEEECGQWMFEGDSQWESSYDGLPERMTLERKTRSLNDPHRGGNMDFANSIVCNLMMTPLWNDADDMSEPATVSHALLEIREYEHEVSLMPKLSELLTSKHLMVWEQYE